MDYYSPAPSPLYQTESLYAYALAFFYTIMRCWPLAEAYMFDFDWRWNLPALGGYLCVSRVRRKKVRKSKHEQPVKTACIYEPCPRKRQEDFSPAARKSTIIYHFSSAGMRQERAVRSSLPLTGV